MYCGEVLGCGWLWGGVRRAEEGCRPTRDGVNTSFTYVISYFNPFVQYKVSYR